MFRNLSFSRAETRILSHICRMQGEKYEREIATGAKVSAGSANSILRRYESAGLVKRVRRGRMSFYRRNDSCPFLRQYRVLMTVAGLMPVLDEAAPLSARITLLAPHSHGAESGNQKPTLLIISRNRDMLRRVFEGHPDVAFLATDQAGLARIWENDEGMRERIAEGFELYSEG